MPETNTINMLPVISLKVEKIQKIIFAEITPDRNTVIISGKNGAGKSSLCNALKLALGDKVASKLITRPITEGEDHASVTVDLGKFKINRAWNNKGKSTTKIESSDGATYKTPAEMLKNIVEFNLMSEKEQVKVLLELIDLPINLDDLAEQREEAYGVRTLINRSVTWLQGQAEGHPHPGNNVPDAETSTSAIMTKIENVCVFNSSVNYKDGADIGPGFGVIVSPHPTSEDDIFKVAQAITNALDGLKLGGE